MKRTITGKTILNSTGSILQVVNELNNTTYTTTSTTQFAATGLNASITPSSSTSKILVMLTGQVQNNVAQGGVRYAIAYNNTTVLSSSLGTFDSAGNNAASAAMTFLHYPGTVFTCNYSVYIVGILAAGVTTPGTAFWLGSPYLSFLTLMEVS